MFRALKRVESNGGAPGIDGMTVEELRPYLKRALVGDQGSARQAELSAKPGTAGRDTQAGRGGAAVRDTDSNGSLTPTGDRTGAHAAIRAESSHRTVTGFDPDEVRTMP